MSASCTWAYTGWISRSPVWLQVEKLPELAHWKLYLVDWGYNTQEEKEAARASTRIELISKGRLRQLMG